MFSFINILGLSVGITCCVIIYIYVHYESSYDTFNKKADNIYRLTLHVHQPQGDIESAATAPLMGPLIQQNFPEIKKTVRFSWPMERFMRYKDKRIYDNKVILADSTFFDVFTFSFLEGNPKTALNGTYKIVLSESTAKKYFGNESALDKIMDYGSNKNVTVSAVIKDVPENSHFKFDALLSRSSVFAMNDTTWLNEKENNWYWIFNYTYFLLDQNCDVKGLETKISKLTASQYPERRKATGIWYDGKLQSIKDIHLKSAMDREIMPNSDIKYIYIFSAVAVLILLIACFNFVNLSTARSLNRSKEIGLRKVVGAARYQLIQQFLGESILFTLIAGICSVIMVYLFLPLFNSFAGIDAKPDQKLMLLYPLFIFSVGIFSGLYPAFLISSFKPVRSLKGLIRHSVSDLFFRKGLVIFQFSIAIVLITGTQVILRQLHFVQNKKMGIQKEQMLQITFRRANKEQQETFLNQLLNDPNVVSASRNTFSFKEMSAIPLMLMGEGEQQGYNAYPVIYIDENFLKTFQLSLVSGRNISKSHPLDEKESFLVNESAVRTFGWKSAENALGKMINWAGEKQGHVIGVIKDFNYTSLHDGIKPLILHTFPGISSITIRLKTSDMPVTIGNIERKWKTMFSDVPFNYTFMQEDFDNMYKSEQKLASILSAFTGLSVLVACLGLFGLATYSIKQRIKEIGIRKILGASIYNITTLVSRDFMKLVGISVLIATPVAWYVSHKWLEDFAYKIELNSWIFLIAGALALFIAFVTVFIQALKSATANPVKNLRTE